ncbi:CpsB/CapC family capsule biosynthesis tyrosine phosphatase [Polyangium sp. 6x1]|uniref:tyrosine-protein phosphatase n=1 Tax=Polyangium sp. 6x1 TaxID=3042689 RepID=UPI00248213BA|nr:CpsB/CapC family capsule biosynthesis tyrosine phosphatase [Polyangium sp. 6x1]MDI1450867.1 protein tyrosine phosphatase [Polyangium sp. 6x1]
MTGYIDLHCHWVAGIDDGVKTVADSRALLMGLAGAGFGKVVATPHMRPGMFDNTKSDLARAYEATRRALADAPGLPELALSSEHFFDDVVYERLMRGEALPYPGERAVLVELSPRGFPARLASRFADLRRKKKLRPVLAHPERYEPVWDDRTVLEPLLDGGVVLLLDVAALVGKYGRATRKCAEALLSEGYYYAACSDAHGPRDVEDVAAGIEHLHRALGAAEARDMLIEGPLSILEGRVDT